ncbi:FKBP-type peptidyl-prolyl cis-trans isomerase [Nonomuraea sp. NEAU-A123]|uniref:FKBP-type peptidyl-prolyl cis-trans isomerase n=1 Tax=Nonomuraea sp. NEAU-A123 TaxID=2839649 RepID=UPI001BE3F79F|nr:FKBP-type peptidyl-prolyl cis-trans isomerase [Nonomuraea sp. NEAU-A123]MBT2233069.1 FKBP-type peptidyl-prolyl cis-trans isomerase [Nonomuraea sp. NEAU-A123]
MRLLWLAVLGLLTACDLAGQDRLPVVTGDFGDRPVITIPAGEPDRVPRVTVLSTGSGRRTIPGDVVLADVEVRGWSGNRPYANTYDAKRPAKVVFDGRHAPDSWREALIGRTAGSRVMLIAPAAQAYGPGLPLGGARPAETLVLVFDVLGGYPPDARLVGRPLPDVPDDRSPHVLIGGSGPPVRAGSKVIVQYVTAEWPGRRVVDSSYRRGGPSAFTLGPEAAPPGWVAGLAGQRVGARVAFPAGAGRSLLYVVDIVDVL